MNSTPNPDFIIRKAIASDVQAMFDLVMELATYEKAPEQVLNTPAQMLIDGFGPDSIYRAWVAEEKSTGLLRGMALYYTAYSTWKGKIYFLDDIIVHQPFRRYGLGMKLISAVLQEAVENKINQIRWQVLDWNEPAIRFYEKIGAELDPEWITCRMSLAEMENFVTKNKS